MATEDETFAKISVNNNIEWNVHNEVKLLLALMGHKPVGIAKHFHMACILDKFSLSVQRDDISSQVIWDKLDTLYDMQALEDSEALPFPNEPQDFSLPSSEYGSMLAQKTSVRMPPPPAPSPPPDNKKDDLKESKKDVVKKRSLKDDSKDMKEFTDWKDVDKLEDRKTYGREFKKELKEEPKKDKRLSKEPLESKKEKTSVKGKELGTKESRLTKRISLITKDDEDSSVSSTGSAKRSRDNSDTDDAGSTPKLVTNSGTNNQSANGKGKRQTRLSHASKVSDDSGSNKSVSPLTVSSPAAKRRRNF